MTDNDTANKKPENTTPETPIAEREKRILKFWQENDIFEKSLKKDAPKGNFVFYDGPPFATGLPHFGHVVPTTLKDIVPRYKTMRGYHVPRRWGWDCHGLPIENLIEKELGLKSKRDIENIGVEVFNRAARNSVLRYAKEWKEIIPRLGRWVDMDNDYRSMDSSFTESVWWSFAELNKKKLVYQDYKVMPYCYRCGTSLANFEVNLGYKDIADLSAYVIFKKSDDASTAFIAWTTTPWTLPGNTALAVNPELTYVKATCAEKPGMNFIFAKDRLAAIGTLLKSEMTVVEEILGKDLVGTSYVPPFTYYEKVGTLPQSEEAKRANAWKVYAADFVTAEDGTGIVHIAPAFGADDLVLARSVPNGSLPVVHHVTLAGIFADAVTDFAGKEVKPKDGDSKETKDAHQLSDVEVIKYLAGQGTLFAKEKYVHSYPHCWRCDTPLLNYAMSSWFVDVPAIKDKLVAQNEAVRWVPKEIGEGRFGKWLEGAREWAVSRSRFWGAPLPVWKGDKTGKFVFIDSVATLASKLDNKGNAFTYMRHGQSDCNVKGTISSIDREQSGLTEIGRAQVLASAELLKQAIASGKAKPVTNIYSSDFRRTRETAEMMAEALGLGKDAIVFDERLREINAGDFDGGSWAERAAYFANIEERITKKVPNGESVADVKLRMSQFLDETFTKHEQAHVLVVTHGLPLRMTADFVKGINARDLMRHGWTEDSDPNASLHEFDYKPLPHNEFFELDLHRPYIDAVTWQEKSVDVTGAEVVETMQRVPEVFDVWYDSGSMPFAQSHYPFENKVEFEQANSPLFPADFIAEGLDQTRGWFYSLLALSVGLFDTTPFKNVSVNGLVLAEDGKKMSKSLKNYPDLLPTVEKYGADTMRYFFASSPIVKAEDFSFSEKALVDVNNKLFNRLGNVYAFYEMYVGDTKTDLDTLDVKASQNVLDQWILARLAELGTAVTENLEVYAFDRASRPFLDFADDLSTWYLRRSRDRFKGDDEADKLAALNTTAYVFHTLSLLLAPFTPFFAEEIYQKVGSHIQRADKKESVHLEAWPTVVDVEPLCIEYMQNVRKVVEAGLAQRSAAGIKARQPLASVSYGLVGGAELSPAFEQIIADELNVKGVKKMASAADLQVMLDVTLTPELKQEGIARDVLRAIQELRKTANLAPSDRISVTVDAEDGVQETIETYKEMLMKTASVTAVNFAKLEGEVTLTEPLVKIQIQKV